jgi:2-polyprenyl-3-methyl-5-hydroxy-6-metoxy-1,4-benzoquinol methylase
MMNENLNNEREFHDEWARSVDPTEVDVEGAWSALATPETFWIAEQLGDIRGLKVLDLGCGLGEGAVHFALMGADVTASDLSPEMCRITSEVARIHGVSVTSLVTSATDLSSVKDATFDIVYGANMLHHVDIDTCITEAYRVLKPGGRAVFWDPVQYNPIINIYRRMAAGVRTVDEHPLRMADIRGIRQKFGSITTRYFWLTATLIFIRFFLIDRIGPSEGRYWKLVIERREKHRKLLALCHAIDRFILRTFPPIKWWCWNVAIVARKD